jgi:7-cyano-7-deazaguanine synthase
VTTVLLYSGGLDSYLCTVLHRPDLLLYVDMGTDYGNVEASRVRIPPGFENRFTLTQLDLARWEYPNRIIPARNAHLALVAAQYGDVIWLGATAGDRTADKDDGFAARMNDLFAHLYQPQWWLPDGRTVTVELPVKKFTKRALVRAYLDSGYLPEDLTSGTFSCYTPRGAEHCGECKPCVRRWVALAACGVDPGYDSRPWVADMVGQVKAGKWDRGRDEADDVIAAWEATDAGV